jgi:hypothetical protein
MRSPGYPERPRAGTLVDRPGGTKPSSPQGGNASRWLCPSIKSPSAVWLPNCDLPSWSRDKPFYCVCLNSWAERPVCICKSLAYAVESWTALSAARVTGTQELLLAAAPAWAHWPSHERKIQIFLSFPPSFLLHQELYSSQKTEVTRTERLHYQLPM